MNHPNSHTLILYRNNHEFVSVYDALRGVNGTFSRIESAYRCDRCGLYVAVLGDDAPENSDVARKGCFLYVWERKDIESVAHLLFHIDGFSEADVLLKQLGYPKTI